MYFIKFDLKLHDSVGHFWEYEHSSMFYSRCSKLLWKLGMKTIFKKKIEFSKIVFFKICFFSSIITFCKNIRKRFPGLSENLFSVAMTTRVHVTYFDIMFNFSLVALKQWLALLWMSILNTWKIERCYLQQVCVSWSFSWGFLVLWR